MKKVNQKYRAPDVRADQTQDQSHDNSGMPRFEQNENSLPAGWRKVRLRDVSESIQYGYTESSSTKKVGPKFLRITDIQDNHVEWENVPFCKIDKELTGKYLLKNGDLVFARTGATVGKSFLIKGKVPEAVFASYLIRVRVNKEADMNYISHFFNSAKYWSQITEGQVGIGQPNVNGTKLSQLELPLPPSDVQYQIVSKIDELFSELDKGTEQLKTAQQQLKVYRQAVLKYAFEGRLTNEDVNDGELPKGWRKEQLNKACLKIQDGSHFSPQVQYNEPAKGRFKYITAKNIRNNFMDLSKLFYADKEFHESIFKRCNPEFGDVLLTKDGVNTGEVTLNTLHEPFSLLSSVCVFKTDKTKLHSEFLKYYIQSPFGQKLIINSMTGTAIKRIILRKIRVAEIGLPGIKEQQLITQEIESRLSVCDKLEETINNSLSQAEALRQSILKKAFEGKLVSQIEVENIRSFKPSMREEQIQEMAAEPKVEYDKKSQPDQVQFPKVIEGIKATDLHAGILAMVIEAHETSSQHHMKLSHVKGEKIAHLVEAHIGIDLGRVPKKDAAGPDDFSHLKKIEHRASKANWFAIKKLAIGHTYVSKPGMPKAIAKVKGSVSTDDLFKIENLIKTFLPFELEHAEVIATLYAGWNNLLLEGKKPTDEDIVCESRESWSKRKLTIERESFFKALKWMKEHGYIPLGLGKPVLTANIRTKGKARIK
jgi:restriction endonuclease S subunit